MACDNPPGGLDLDQNSAVYPQKRRQSPFRRCIF
jgi:hypothetical protein